MVHPDSGQVKQRLARALRDHRNRRGLSQEAVANRVGYGRRTVMRVEAGEVVPSEKYMAAWLMAFRADRECEGVKTAYEVLRSQVAEARREAADSRPSIPDLVSSVSISKRLRGNGIDDMNRRELLRLLSMAGSLLATSPVEGRLDWERLAHFPDGASRLDWGTLEEFARLNGHLWRVFALSRPKCAALPLVRNQLDVLTSSLEHAHGPATHQRLCALTGDLFQLAGEIFFDSGQYTDAAHCYALAAAASKEAGAFDLWACAMTRHAFIGVYERRFDKAAPMLELAARLAQRGDGTLSTRHWVSAVRAQAFAGLGDVDACHRALDSAEQVRELSGPVHNGGWLRFDDSRLAEERGTCYVELRRPNLAEAILAGALSQDLSTRRRGIVLTDLAMTGVQRRDRDRLVMYANAALDVARQSRSGVIARKLQGLQPHLVPLLGDRHVRHLDRQIAALVEDPTA